MLRARNMLGDPWHWAAVKALAKTLLKEKHIGSKKAREIIRAGREEKYQKALKAREAKEVNHNEHL